MSRPFEYGWTDTSPTPAHEYLLPAVKRLMPDGDSLTIMDVGCGNGWVAGALAAMGHTVIGVDLATDGIALARCSYPDLRFEIASVYDDLTKIATNVDVAICTEVIEHLYSPQALLENASSVLRKGGTFILSTPYHGYLKNLAISAIRRGMHITTYNGRAGISSSFRNALYHGC